MQLSRLAADGRFATGCVSMRVQNNAELARPAKSVGGLPDLLPSPSIGRRQRLLKHGRAFAHHRDKNPLYGKFSNAVRRETG